MVNFALISGLSLMMIIITCLFQYEVMRIVWNLLPRLTVAPRLRVLLIVVPIFAIHIVNIWLYAAAFFLIEHFTSIGVLAGRNQFAGVLYESFVNALYFSATTYTSLGFGDIVPTNDLRMLTGRRC